MSHESISNLQDRIYTFIVECMKAEGMPPTIREIGQKMQITSTGHIDFHLKMLEKRGLIARTPHKSRGIKLTSQTLGIPIIGAIAAGVPLDIFPDTPEMLLMHYELQGENNFALVVRGWSMINDYICDGDYVVVKSQQVCRDGDIVVATNIQDGANGSATLKRFFQERDRVRLQPANLGMEPLLIPKVVWDREWQVQGTVIGIFRWFQTAIRII